MAGVSFEMKGSIISRLIRNEGKEDTDGRLFAIVISSGKIMYDRAAAIRR